MVVSACSLYGLDRVRFATIPKYQGLYSMTKQTKSTEPMAPTALMARHISAMDLYAILGHISPLMAIEMVRKGVITGFKLSDTVMSFCKTCIHVKQSTQDIPKVQTSPKLEHWGQRIHTDVCGPAKVNSLGGMCYFVTFINDATNKCFVSFLKHKSEVFKIY